MITINDTPIDYPQPKSLQDILLAQAFDPALVVAEVNASLVKREDYETFMVPDGATIEVFTFVGGG